MGVNFKAKPTVKEDSPLIEKSSIRTKKMVKKERETFPIIKINNHSKQIVKKHELKKESSDSILEKRAVEMATSFAKEHGINFTARNFSLLKEEFKRDILEKKNAEKAKKARKARASRRRKVPHNEEQKFFRKEEVPLDEEQKYQNFLRRQTGEDEESDSSDSSDARWDEWLKYISSKGKD
jgi:hypothetical protein